MSIATGNQEHATAFSFYAPDNPASELQVIQRNAPAPCHDGLTLGMSQKLEQNEPESHFQLSDKPVVIPRKASSALTLYLADATFQLTMAKRSRRLSVEPVSARLFGRMHQHWQSAVYLN